MGRCRSLIHQERLGIRGRKDDPLYRACRTLYIRAELLTDRKVERLTRCSLAISTLGLTFTDSSGIRRGHGVRSPVVRSMRRR